MRLPDGRLQITSYQADEAGFRPKISYEIDPLFVPPPAEPIIPFIPDKKFIRRPPPKSYDAIPQSYVPPAINYDPRGYKNPHHFPEKPAINYVTPKPYHDNIPGVGYKAPKKPGILYAPPSHSELKFRKKSIFVGRKTHYVTFSKVQKNIFCYFKNGKKSIFAPKKCLKL